MKMLSIKNLGVLKELIQKYGNAKVIDVIECEKKSKTGG